MLGVFGIPNLWLYSFLYFFFLAVYLSTLGSINSFQNVLDKILVFDVIVSSALTGFLLYLGQTTTTIGMLSGMGLLTISWCLASFVIFALIPSFLKN